MNFPAAELKAHLYNLNSSCRAEPEAAKCTNNFEFNKLCSNLSHSCKNDVFPKLFFPGLNAGTAATAKSTPCTIK